MANTDLSSATIGQASINVHDVDQAVAFYRDTLGLRFLFQAGPKMAFFDCGGVRLMLAVPEKPEFDHPGSVFYFKVGDIQAAAATLQIARRAVRGSALPDRRPARSRPVDGLLPRRGRQPASADERSAARIGSSQPPHSGVRALPKIHCQYPGSPPRPLAVKQNLNMFKLALADVAHVLKRAVSALLRTLARLRAARKSARATRLKTSATINLCSFPAFS
jgi:catechol 2,3-dioxygenase-like lactoylglutathione lyase family enzyme